MISGDKSTDIQSSSKKSQIRCFCVHKPLLGIVGQDKDGYYFEKKYRKFVDMRVYGESEIRIRCHVCFRLHKITIKKKTIKHLTEA